MSDLDGIQGSDFGSDTGAGDDQSIGQEQSQDSSGGNPAWEPLRQKLDPVLFKSIEEDLRGWDKSANQRIESVNQQYAPFKALVDQGLTPQSISQSVQIAKAIDADPVAFHARLTEYLRVNGKMPETQQELADVASGDEETEDDQTQDDPRYAQLAAQQEQLAQFVFAQQQAEVQRQADTELDSEVQSLRNAHPELSPEDVQEVIRRAATTALMNRQTGNRNIPSLEEAHQEIVDYRNRILTAPRAGDSAPRLLPTSGGVPSQDGQRKSLGALSNEETVSLLAGLIDKK